MSVGVLGAGGVSAGVVNVRIVSAWVCRYFPLLDASYLLDNLDTKGIKALACPALRCSYCSGWDGTGDTGIRCKYCSVKF